MSTYNYFLIHFDVKPGDAPKNTTFINLRSFEMDERWQLNGQVLVACNCDWGCPCNFNALPTTGKCEGGWTWQVESGWYNDTKLDGLNFSVYVNWPGAIHEGNGEAVILF